MDRVTIQWTQTAKNCLAKLPLKVRRGLLAKAGELRTASDPTLAHKPLTGPLQGYFQICYSRYRAIYSVEKVTMASGEVVQRVKIVFVAAGIRKEGDKNDIYKFATKLVRLGVIALQEGQTPPEN